MEALVSVIVPTFNRCFMVKQAIHSVLRQSYPCIEIIVVDDASQTDVISELKKSFGGGIKYIRHNINRGAAAARNTALRFARGEFCAFIDDDDLWYPEKLSWQMKYFAEDDQIGLVSCGYQYLVNGKIARERLPYCNGDTYLALLRGNFIGSASLPVVRRHCLEAVGGFDAKLSSCQDWDLWLRLAKRYPFRFVNKALVIRQIHPDQMTGNIRRKIEGRLSIVKKYMTVLQQDRRLYGLHLRRLASLHLFEGLRAQALGYYILSIRSFPLDLLGWIGIALCFFPRTVQKAVLEHFSFSRVGGVILFH